jgi:hypothetical protein
MKRICTPALFLLLSYFAHSQKNIIGVWQGYFVQESTNPFTGRITEDKYKFEIQINQLPDNSLEGVTYSYKTTVFYGKAAFHGIYNKTTNNVLIKELKMLDLKISDQSVPCLMTCYLDYTKNGKSETLTGNYTSLNTDSKSDCGDGTIYLKKVDKSDFKKEDFLLKKSTVKKADSVIIKSSSNKNIKALQSALGLIPDGVAGPKTIQTLKQRIPDFNGKLDGNDSTAVKSLIAKLKSKPTAPIITAKPSVIKKDTVAKKKVIVPPVVINKIKPGVKPNVEEFIVRKPKETIKTDTIKEKIIVEERKPEQKSIPVPKILQDRENNLINTIEIAESEVQIDYYDNGEIDNDTITVYHNNKLVVNHGRLSYTPITLHIKLTEQDPVHEIITVANNLGDVPPNTALMVITTAKMRKEVFITSDEKTNAKVIIVYKPAGTSIKRTN